MVRRSLGIFLLFYFLRTITCAPCDIPEGRNAIILDIAESEGSVFNQSTHPAVLPIEGDTAYEIELELSEEGKQYFFLEDKSLTLVGPLDRDEDDLSTIRFEILCSVRSSSQMRNVPVIVRVEDNNDNTPIFIGEPYSVTLPEDTPVGSAIFRGIHAEDSDSGVNGQVLYRILRVSPSTSSSKDLFDISLPHQGVVFLKAPLDYEDSSQYTIDIIVTDLSPDETLRRTATTSLLLRIEDVDDQDPQFDTADPDARECPNALSECPGPTEYRSSIVEGKVSGALNIYPGRIHAKDLDSIGALIMYKFVSGIPGNFEEYFEIDERTAVVNQIKAVDRSEIKYFELVIEATERTSRKGSSRARLRIDVQRVDTSPPRVITPSYPGIVQEASEPGTPVIRNDGSGQPFSISVEDADYRPGEDLPKYKYELTTTAFNVTVDGVLVVAIENLNRDYPSQSEHTFQIIAREDIAGGAASIPVSVKVILTDINDNAPRLPVYPVISVPAGSSRRSIITVKAIDVDEGPNAEVSYSLNGASDKFSINSLTGEVMSKGELVAGEQYQLIITATDKGGLSGEGILEISVSRGPNTNGPIFSRSRYGTSVPENAPFGYSVIALQAIDPEGDPAYYSLVKGNEDSQFEIDSLSGQLSVVSPLDREKLEFYNLVIQAEDADGKSNEASVSIRVTDVNDNPPEFSGLPFSFRVDEGAVSANVGQVKAADEDLGLSGKISYLIEDKTMPFNVNEETGEIFTKSALDYEQQKVFYLPIVAHDVGNDPLSSTATVTVLVNDLSDEVPVFDQRLYNISVPENVAIGSLVTTLQAVDPDTIPSVTYKLLKGDTSAFKVAPDTGRVTVTSKLDFERKKLYTLNIGTEEGKNSKENKSTAIVEIHLEDVNDEEPTLEPLSTITLPRTAPVGSLVVNVSATDKDGTSPNNKIHFALSGEEAVSFFSIHTDRGEIRIKESLTKALFKELSVEVLAKDGGNPSHFASTSFKILLLESVTRYPQEPFKDDLTGQNGHISSLASSPRFSKTKFELLVNEDIDIGSVVLRVPLVNITSSIACSILNGQKHSSFETVLTEENTCDLKVRHELDFEKRNSYIFTLVLHPNSADVTDIDNEQVPLLSECFVSINVADVNDNSPVFSISPSDISSKFLDTFILSYVLENAEIGSRVADIQATDEDSGGQEAIEYYLLPESNRGNYFSINSQTGRLYTHRTLTDVPLELKPFNLTLIATDKVGVKGVQHSTAINIIVPVIEETHQSVLLVEGTKDEVSEKVHAFMSSASVVTGKTAQVELLSQDAKGTNDGEPLTQIWFHLLEPEKWQPVPAEILQDGETKTRFQREIDTSGILPEKNFLIVTPIQAYEDKAKIMVAIVEEEETTVLPVGIGVVPISTLESLGAAEYVLLILACLIVLFVLCAILAICILWSKFTKRWNAADKTVMLIPPLIDAPTPSVIDISKEYEVQVLHMSVPLDDDSVGETQADIDAPNQPFFLDNVSYISKSHTNQDGSSSGGAGSSGQATPRSTTRNDWALDPHEPLDAQPTILSASASNENVLFGRREFPEPSPVETTTEL